MRHFPREATGKSLRTRCIKYVTDPHGATITVSGSDRMIVLDLVHRKLRVFVTNSDGEVNTAPVSELELD